MKILTIDGNNLVHRVYWVAKNMANKTDDMHVYMFLNSVKSYVEMFKPDRVICVWDEKRDYSVNKRKEILPEYKGNRDKEYNLEVHTKNELIKDLLLTLGIPSVYPRSYEADDVIKIIDIVFDRIARSQFFMTKKPYRHVIVTVDKDLCQMISRKVSVYDPIKKVEITEDNFEDILKYPIKEFIKVKALQGDKSDNIPGIKGFGKVKIERFLNGSVNLTEKEVKQYNKNLQLVTLTEDKDEIEYVKEQLEDVTFDKNKEKFLELCKKHKFKQVEKNEMKWYTAFFENNRLIELLS